MTVPNKTPLNKLQDINFHPKLPKNILVEDRAGCCLVLDPLKPDWFFCSSDLRPVLEIIDGTRTLEQIRQISDQVLDIPAEAVESFLRFLIDELYVLEAPKLDSNITLEGMLLDMVYLHLTSRCNQNCVYCYRPNRKGLSNEIRRDEIEGLVSDIAVMNPNATIVLTGGEPLLRRDIVSICDFIKTKGLRIEVNTNGSLIHKFPELTKLVDIFNVSMDGSSAKIHDALRGPGTHARTERALLFLEEKGAKFVITPTVTSLNLTDIPNLLSKYKNVRCSFKSNVLMRIGKGKHVSKLSVTPEDLCWASRQFSAMSKASMDFLPQRFVRKISCGMGVRYLSVESNGDVYPCQLMHVNSLLMGNIRLSSLAGIYWHSPVSKFCRGFNVNIFEECQSCPIKYLCGGGCRARAFFERGSLNLADGFCAFWRDIYLKAIWYDAPEGMFAGEKLEPPSSATATFF